MQNKTESDLGRWVVTLDHPQSSYGLPVLVDTATGDAVVQVQIDESLTPESAATEIGALADRLWDDLRTVSPGRVNIATGGPVRMQHYVQHLAPLLRSALLRALDDQERAQADYRAAEYRAELGEDHT